MEEEKKEKKKISGGKIVGIIIIILLVIIAVLGCIAGIQMKNKNEKSKKTNISNVKLDKEVTTGRLTYYVGKNWKTDELTLEDNISETYYISNDTELSIYMENNEYGNDIDKSVDGLISTIKESDENEFISKDKKTIKENTYGVVEDYVRISTDKSQRITYILLNDDKCFLIQIIQKDKIDSQSLEFFEKFIEKIKVEGYYSVITDYDGVYKFSLKNNNSDIAIGLISFDNGKCKIKSLNYNFNSSDNQSTYEYDGICGKDEENNFYFTVFKESNTSYYDCVHKLIKSDENGLSFKLESGYDLTRHVTTEELNLTLVGKNDINFEDEFKKFSEEEKNRINTEEQARKEAEAAAEQARKEQEKADYKASCQSYTYEQLARNPESIKGNNVKVTGEVVQAMYGSYSVELRVDITNNGYYYEDTIYVTYNTSAGEDKILEGDIITIYGTASGDYSYTSVLGASVTLPKISAKYIER